MKLAVLFLILVEFLSPVRAQTKAHSPLPQVLTFVAPAYPRLASDGRIMGSTGTHIRVAKDGKVTEAKVVQGHQIFAKYVLSALKQWTFVPSEQEAELEVICKFEFVDEDKCLRDDGQPITPETVVSVKLPSEVMIQTTLKCLTTTVTTSDPVER